MNGYFDGLLRQMGYSGPKAEALAFDPAATCRMESFTHKGASTPTAGRWAVVRDGSGRMIGKHRTTKAAWEEARNVLRRKSSGRKRAARL